MPQPRGAIAELRLEEQREPVWCPGLLQAKCGGGSGSPGATPPEADEGGWQGQGCPRAGVTPGLKGEGFVFNFHGNRWRNSIFN